MIAEWKAPSRGTEGRAGKESGYMSYNMTNMTPPIEYNKEKGYKSVGEILTDMLQVSNSAFACAYRKHIADKSIKKEV